MNQVGGVKPDGPKYQRPGQSRPTKASKAKSQRRPAPWRRAVFHTSQRRGDQRFTAADERQAALTALISQCLTDGEPLMQALPHAQPRSADLPAVRSATRSTTRSATRLAKVHLSPRSGGFTLVELMVVVAIIGILAAVGYPSYSDYIVRGALADANSGLATVRASMERYYQDNRTYASVGTFTTPCAVNAAQRAYGNFVVACVGTPAAATYTLSAQGSGSVAGFTFTVNETDVRATTAAPTGYSTCATKWLMKKGAAC